MQRTPLNPMSKRRRAELAALGITHPTNTLVSKPGTPAKATVRRAAPTRTDTGPDAATVDLVLARDLYSCVVCGHGVGDRRGIDFSIHHRIRRAQGVDNTPSNLITVCGNGTQGDHAAIHAAPKWARDTGGWLLKRGDDPATCPVLVERGARWVLLKPNGRAVTCRPPQESEVG